MKIILEPTISLNTLHLGIPKQELKKPWGLSPLSGAVFASLHTGEKSKKGSLVASVFYFSLNTDVVSNHGIPAY